MTRRSKLHRQTIWKILKDDRDYLGQMPEDRTMQAIADGFNIPVERVREAAARSLSRYQGGDDELATNLELVDIDILLAEIRRRVLLVGAGKQTKTPLSTHLRRPPDDDHWVEEHNPRLGQG